MAVERPRMPHTVLESTRQGALTHLTASGALRAFVVRDMAANWE